MNINDYQKWSVSVAVYPGAGQHQFNEALYLTLGLASEAGEVAGKVKKIIRGDKVDPFDVVSEMSDVLWYLTRLCDNLGMTVEDLADVNFAKLEKRKETNTIQGDGDKRELAKEAQEDASKIITSNS